MVVGARRFLSLRDRKRPAALRRRLNRLEVLERRELLAGFLAALPEGFVAAAVAQDGPGSYVVAGQAEGRPAVVRVIQQGANVQTTLEMLNGLPTGDGRGAVGALTSDAQTLVGATQSDRSDSAGFGEATIWNAAGEPTPADLSDAPGVDDQLLGISENGVAVGERFGEPIVVTADHGLTILHPRPGRVDAVSDDGALLAGVLEGATVFWTADTVGERYTVGTLELPRQALPLTTTADVSSDGSWIAGAFFSAEKADIAPALWDSQGKLLRVFASPIDNVGVVVDNNVALVNGVVDRINFTPTTRIYWNGGDGTVDLLPWLAQQDVGTELFDQLNITRDVVYRAAGDDLLIVGQGVSQGQERSFLAVVEDFVIPPPSVGAIIGRVWSDIDGNGRQDVDETGGVSGVLVELRGPAGSVVASTTTDDLGLYEFRGIAPGSYRVRFYAPEGQFFSPSDVDDDVGDSDANRFSGETSQFTLAAGQLLDWDAGLTSEAFIPPWQNPENRYDVDGSGDVSISDLLALVRDLRDKQIRELPPPGDEQPPPYVDVDGDNFVTLNDLREVVSILRAANENVAGESEAAAIDHFWGQIGNDREEEWWRLG